MSVPLQPSAIPALARAIWVIGPLLVLIPVVDVAPVLFAPNLGELRWRFGAVGIVSSALMTPLFGLFLMIAAATLLEQRRLVRVFGWLCLASAAVLVAVTVIFVMDFLEVRHLAQRESRDEITMASLKALAKLVLALAGAIALGLLTLRQLRDAPASGELPTSMLVGTSLGR